MKKIIAILFIFVVGTLLFFMRFGLQDGLQDGYDVDVEKILKQIKKEDNPNRRELFAEYLQIIRQGSAGREVDIDRAFWISVCFDYPDDARFFIEQGADIDKKSPLCVAAEGHCFEMTKMLVESGATLINDNKNPLRAAIKNRNFSRSSSVRHLERYSEKARKEERKKVIIYLLENGATISSDILLDVISFGEVDILEELLKVKTVKLDDNCLVAALETGNIKLLEFLVENKVMKLNQECVKMALMTGNKESVRFLLLQGAPVPKKVEMLEIPSENWSIGKYEVTQKEYQEIMGENPSRFKGGDMLPVENVSWESAMKFCKKLTERERILERLPAGYKYTLPTSKQWEIACRAGTTTKYASGDSEEDLSRVAWWKGNSENKTHPVGTKVANAWYIYDMHGNVWEWCLEPDLDDSSRRIVCGGSFNQDANVCGVSCRGKVPKSDTRIDLGFRVVLVRTNE